MTIRETTVNPINYVSCRGNRSRLQGLWMLGRVVQCIELCMFLPLLSESSFIVSLIGVTVCYTESWHTSSCCPYWNTDLINCWCMLFVEKLLNM